MLKWCTTQVPQTQINTQRERVGSPGVRNWKSTSTKTINLKVKNRGLSGTAYLYSFTKGVAPLSLTLSPILYTHWDFFRFTVLKSLHVCKCCYLLFTQWAYVTQNPGQASVDYFSKQPLQAKSIFAQRPLHSVSETTLVGSPQHQTNALDFVNSMVELDICIIL